MEKSRSLTLCCHVGMAWVRGINVAEFLLRQGMGIMDDPESLHGGEIDHAAHFFFTRKFKRIAGSLYNDFLREFRLLNKEGG